MKITLKEIKPIVSSAGSNQKVLMAVVNENGKILQTNARMQKQLQLKNPREGEYNLFDLVHPFYIESLSNAFKTSSILSRSESVNILIKNGVYHPISLQINTLSAEKNGLKTFFCMGSFNKLQKNSLSPVPKDNTSRDYFFRSFLDYSSDLVWAINEESRLVLANNIFLQYFNLDESDLNKKISEILPLSVADALYEKHLKVFQTGIPLESIELGKLADGTKNRFRVTLFPSKDQDGNKIIGGIAKDQSEGYIIEKKLEAANERLINLSKITSDAIWEWDMLSGDILRNEKLTELTGFLTEDQKGLSWWIGRIHPEDRNKLSDILKDVTDKGLQSWESEYRFLCADGEYKNMLDRGFVIYNNGMPVKMIGSLSDITNQKLMENLLIEERLRQYKIISESAMRIQEQERSRLGREMHDNVNQILSTIKLFVGMLKASTKEEADIKKKTEEYTVMAIEEIRKLSKEMVAPQLDGRQLTEQIKNIIADIELSTVLRIKFTHDNENELLSPGKKLALFRIVQEQFKNIIKYSKATKVELLLHCKSGTAQLVIKDNGIGFDPKKISSGIGLSSIRERVKFYSGKTELISSPGNGCELIVSIPLID